MRKRLLGRPSPATVIASIALFVSLGGVSYGVATGSIDSREIKNNTVRSKDIRTSGVASSDVANNKLTGADVLESSLGKVPSSSRADTAGAAGNAAAVGGIISTRLVRDVEYKTGASTDAGQTKQVFINCSAGKKIIGGGSQIGGTEVAFLQTDRPIVNDTQWFGQARGATAGDTDYSLSATVICANVN